MAFRESLTWRLALLAMLNLTWVLGTLACHASDKASRNDERESPQLREVLARWAYALGGAERLAAVEVSHSRLDARMFGLDGTIESWETADGRQRFDLDLAGLFRITQVYGPDGAWQRDQNGKVNELAGKNLEDAVTGVYLATYSHLLPDRLPGRAELLASDPETGLLRVRIYPLGGTPTLFQLDPKTYLPVRSEAPHANGETLTTTFADWREFDGIMFPVVVHQSTGTPENDVHLTLTSVSFDDRPPAGTFERPVEEADDVRFVSGAAARDIPLDLDGVHIFLQGELNDSQPLWFVLDTGASITVVDTDLAQELGLELTGKVMAGGQGEGKAEVNLIQDASFRVPGVEINGQTVAAIALREILEARFGHPIDGVLGYDFISRFVVEIDYAHGRLHLYDRNGWTYAGDGEVVPIRIVDSQPHCDIVIEARGRGPIACDVMVDTGSGGCLGLARPFTQRYDLLETLPRKVLHEGGYGIGGESREWLGRLEALRLGDVRIEQPLVDFSLDSRGGGADVTSAGLLGGRVLEQFTVIFDYTRERMILEPNDRYGQPIRYDLSGLTIATGGRENWHRFEVLRVTEGSPGQRAGVQPGDVITAVDGRPAAALMMQDLTRLFCEKGREVMLELQRDEETLPAKLDLEPYI
jgi:hypothetical protein